jgi:hypothetical protein
VRKAGRNPGDSDYEPPRVTYPTAVILHHESILACLDRECVSALDAAVRRCVDETVSEMFDVVENLDRLDVPRPRAART